MKYINLKSIILIIASINMCNAPAKTDTLWDRIISSPYYNHLIGVNAVASVVLAWAFYNAYKETDYYMVISDLISYSLKRKKLKKIEAQKTNIHTIRTVPHSALSFKTSLFIYKDLYTFKLVKEVNEALKLTAVKHCLSCDFNFSHEFPENEEIACPKRFPLCTEKNYIINLNEPDDNIKEKITNFVNEFLTQKISIQKIGPLQQDPHNTLERLKSYQLEATQATKPKFTYTAGSYKLGDS